MVIYTMTIIEETDSEYKSELKLWENTDGKIWLEVGLGDNEPCLNQGITLTKNDALALAKELERLAKELS